MQVRQNNPIYQFAVCFFYEIEAAQHSHEVIDRRIQTFGRLVKPTEDDTTILNPAAAAGYHGLHTAEIMPCTPTM